MSKQLFPVYDKPMIYYSLSVLLLTGIRDIVVISTPDQVHLYQALLRDGSQWGVNLSYAIQDQPRGLADAFIVAENFIAGSPCALILGDNVFYGHALPELLRDADKRADGATVFAYRVSDPTPYGVVGFDAAGNALSLEEKPAKPKSHWVVTGLYFYDTEVVDIAKSISPSDRGELEITDVSRRYMENGRLTVTQMGRGFAWLDTGTHDALLEASEFVRVIERRQGLKIACLEEIALLNGWITASDVARAGHAIRSTDYGRYLLQLVNEE
jgi:glucose-1-phosphate thymidylyltransferase